MVHQINLENLLSHGAPLGADEIKLTKEDYKWTFEEDFYVPEEVYDQFNKTNC